MLPISAPLSPPRPQHSPPREPSPADLSRKLVAVTQMFLAQYDALSSHMVQDQTLPKAGMVICDATSGPPQYPTEHVANLMVLASEVLNLISSETQTEEETPTFAEVCANVSCLTDLIRRLMFHPGAQRQESDEQTLFSRIFAFSFLVPYIILRIVSQRVVGNNGESGFSARIENTSCEEFQAILPFLAPTWRACPILHLSLAGNGLSVLSSDLHKVFPHLTHLDLSDNKFSLVPIWALDDFLHLQAVNMRRQELDEEQEWNFGFRIDADGMALDPSEALPFSPVN